MKSRRQNQDWPFADPKNVAVFTTTQILHSGQPILRVVHDEDDGAWQFHTGAAQVETKALMIVALEEMVEHDQSICELADLPCGWFAERDSIGDSWRRTQR